jgi:DNA-binding NarL/FixJ family response regulator
VGSALSEARAACDDRRWGDARRRFDTSTADDLEVDDLDAYATAAYLTGHDEDGFALWTRAHQRCAEGSSIHRAAHFGVRLAECLCFKGDVPRARGWVDRTANLLEDAEIDCVEQGYLEHALGMIRIFELGDLAGARAHFEQARKIGARFRDRELDTLARIGEGRMMIYLGEPADGLALLDAAVVSIEADELSTVATGDAYCTVIDACAGLSDVVRCRAWTASMQQWCDRHQELVLYRGHCFVHAAEVLRVLGRLPEGLDAARNACGRLADPVPSIRGAALCLEADFLRLLGVLDAAEAAYVSAHEHGHEPQPGLALLHLARGRPDTAAAMIGRVLAEVDGPIFRSRLLPASVDIMLAAGEIAGARTASDELRAIALELGGTMLRGLAAGATGAVLLRDGDATAALIELRRALRIFNDLGANEEVPRTRLLIAEACRALGDDATAALEEAAARTALRSFQHADRDETHSIDVERPDGLTQREVEVLRLLATGKTNRVIGETLFIAEKTVASHVSHIFTKLGVTSRSGATAYAYDNGLV